MQKKFIVTSAVFLAALYTAPAQADMVQLVTGEQMVGDIYDMTDPSGVALRVKSGQVYSIPWNNVAGLYDGAYNEITVPEFASSAASQMTPQAASERPISLREYRAAPQAMPEPVALAAARAPLTQPQVMERPAYALRMGRTENSALNQWGGVPYAQGAPAAGEETDLEMSEATAPDAGWLGAVWSGRINAGASLQTGNTENSAITIDGALKAKWNDKHRATIKAEYNREEDDGDVTEDNRKLSAMYDYFFAEQWFMNTNVSFEQDEIDEIDLRSIAGIGIGHQPFESEELNLQYVLGPSYLHTEYEDGDSEDSLAARWALDYDQYYWDKTLQGFHEHELLVPTDDTDGFLFDSKTGLRLPIRNGIVGTAEVDFEWDNKPEPGIKEDDTTYSLKLGYEW